ncbi:flavin-nucleotide-binding protein [Aspergillus indologenus CBS 114.80]|uniref:Flavin-nucleotide-binding protein n=1 Tax=Aspergillus indologenus CBS 114.80 TaxID=1450541 RepID=A0A2V5J3D2_9EURO|nr:flavin-nucleotide-binding protein [Aspergillus indologenus CBS 114.80]
MGRTLTYPKKPSNTVNRYKHRATYDLGAIHSIINSTQVLHVSFSPGPSEPFPAILPMIGQMGSFDYPSASIDEPLDCYLHGYVSSRIMNLARDSEGEGLPVCVAASKVDGLILSLTPNSHSYNYRSAIIQGYAHLVTDEAEKLYAMELITNSVLADRWANTRVPPDRAEMSSTVILRVKVVSGSGKIRDGGVSDEKKDTGNEEVTDRVWTGVVPVWETFGEPVPSEQNKVAEVPDYISAFVAAQTAGNREYAEKAIGIQLPKEEQH